MDKSFCKDLIYLFSVFTFLSSILEDIFLIKTDLQLHYFLGSLSPMICFELLRPS